MEPKAAPEKDGEIRESSRRCRSSGGEEDADEAQRRSKRSKLQMQHPSSPHRRIRDYRREEEMQRERGDPGAMSHRRHRYEDDSYQHDYHSDKSSYYHADNRRSSRRDDDRRSSRGRDDERRSSRDDDRRSSRRDDDRRSSRDDDRIRSRRYDDRRSSRRYDDRSSHDDRPAENNPSDRIPGRLGVDGGHDGGDNDPQAGQDVSEEEEPLSAAEEEKPSECLMLDNLFDKYEAKAFDYSVKVDPVLIADVKAYAHEICATKGGTVVKIHVDPYAGLVYVRFRDIYFAVAAKKAIDGEIYYNETRLIKATYIDSNDPRMKFLV